MPTTSNAQSQSPQIPGTRARNFRIYLSERFPIPLALILSLALGLCAYAVAQTDMIRAGGPMIVDGTALGGCIVLLMFLFHLRVFDEHKDYELDCATRPSRPVPRGLISLAELRVFAAIAMVAEVILSVTAGVMPALL